MRLIEAVLRGFKHFPLSDIQTLCYKPTVKTQVILGSNGSGKTSLMKELSPLAGKKANYETGGSKEVTYLYKGNIYELKSLFTENGAQFYFIKDGENLNHGLLVSGYTALVEEHFGYTEKKHRLFMGKQRLTTMSVNDRRQWFTDMHGVDYGYAMRYHKKMKERIKELTVAIKVMEERIQTEEARKLSPDAIQALEHDAVKRRNEVRRMISARPGTSQGVKTMVNASYSLQNTMLEIEDLLKTITASPYLLSLKTKQEAEVSIEAFTKAIAKAEGLQASLYRQLEDKQKLSAICNQTNTTQLNALKTQRKELAEKLDILNARSLKNHPVTEISDLAAVEHVFDNSDFIDTVCRYSEELAAIERPSKYASYEDARRHLVALQLDIGKASSLLTRANEHLAVMDEAAKRAAINCLKCGHSWRDGYDESKHQQIKQAVAEHAAELKSLTDAATAAETATQAFNRTVQLNTLLGQLASSTKALVGFWNRFGLSSPRTAFETVKASFYEQIEIAYLQKQLAELDEKIRSGEAIVAQLKDEDVKKIEEDLKTLDLQLSNLTAAIRNDRIILNEQMSYLRTLEAIERLNETLTMDLEEFNRIGKAEIRRQISLMVDDLIHQDNAILTDLEREITQARSRDSLIKELRDDVDRKKIEKALLVEAEEALSPATGLIAKGMMDFVNGFIDEVNEMIGAVWSYPMELGHVRIDEEDGSELDYNFEIKVMGKPKAPDVEDASSGMQEIIDLAFVVVSMQRQGFGDYPLFLDEFAARMDEKHRSSAYKIVEYLCDSTEFSNIFLTSHYQAGYSNLSNAEILVLHAGNLEIPKHLKTNNHVVIT